MSTETKPLSVLQIVAHRNGHGPRVPGRPRMGDIGDNPREYEFEPMTAPAVPERTPAPAPVEPAQVPEEVPAA